MGDESTRGASRTLFTLSSHSVVFYIAFTAVAIEVSFVLLDLLVNYARPDGHGPLRRMFNITREDGMPSWFASTQTLLIALTLWMIWAIVRRGECGTVTRRGWLAVAAFFSYMAVDDGAMIHERIGSTLGNTFSSDSGAEETWMTRAVDWFPSYNWQMFVMPFFAAAGVLLLLFLWHELRDRRSRVLLLVAMGCLTVAVSLDFIEGMDEDDAWNLHTHAARWLELDGPAETWFSESGYKAVVHFSKSIEEFLEMLANTLFWVVFLRRLTGLSRELRIRFE